MRTGIGSLGAEHLDISLDMNGLHPTDVVVQNRAVHATSMVLGSSTDCDRVLLSLMYERDAPFIGCIRAIARGSIDISGISGSVKERLE